MKAFCSQCGKPLSFDDSKFGERPSVRVRCPACQAIVTLNRPASAQAAASEAQTMVAPAPKIAPPSEASAPTAPTPAPPVQTTGKAQVPEPGREFEKSTPTLKVKRQAIAISDDMIEEIPPLPKGLRVSLAVLTGANSGKVYPCAQSRVVLGRAGTDVPLDDDEVSRRHALLEIHEDRYVLKDLGSTNGTFVDERRISEMELHDRGEFRVGTSQIMLIVTPTDEL